jgi:hypothetical protein
MPTNKVIASTLTGLIVFALTKLAIRIDPVVEQAINVALMVVAAWATPNKLSPGGYPDRPVVAGDPQV